MTKLNQYRYKDLTIEILDEPTYEYGSTDNDFYYSKAYFGGEAELYQTSKHGVKVYHDEKVIDCCIIIGSGGSTGIHQNSFLVDNDQIVICCCDTVFCLTLPDLDLKWKTQADQATCFQVFKLQNDYIVHGELLITKLDRNGNKKWEFGRVDIFVSTGKIGFDGRLLSDFLS